MDVDNLNRIIIFQVLAQFSDIHVHATRIEIVVIDPDSLQGKVALQDFVSMRTKQSQQFRFFGSQFRLFVADSQDLLLGIKRKLTNLINIALLVLLSANTSQDKIGRASCRERVSSPV